MTSKHFLVWDAHACFPLRFKADLSELSRYQAAGANFVSINVGMDMDSLTKVVQVLAGFRAYIESRSSEFVLAKTVQDILRAKKENMLAIAFDLEGSEPLQENLNMVSFFYDLGVRQMLLAYNKDNRAAGGCMEGNIGLTEFGRAVVKEMNRVGMMVDVSHMGYKASMEVMEISSSPVVFSHSNAKALRAHARNITDDQIKACAATGGVVAINGIGDFLGSIKSSCLADHIQYVAELVGFEHVGIGLDYCVDKQEVLGYIEAHPEVYPKDRVGNLLEFACPEQIPEIAEILFERNFSEEQVNAIMGENMLRVARQVWK
jgi:membrane dipeptidase